VSEYLNIFSLLMKMLGMECSDSDYVQINTAPFHCARFDLKKPSTFVVFISIVGG
jgi:hypothetical protein